MILGICPEIPPKPTNYLNWGGLSDGNISEVLVTPISDGLTGAKGEIFVTFQLVFFENVESGSNGCSSSISSMRFSRPFLAPPPPC